MSKVNVKHALVYGRLSLEECSTSAQIDAEVLLGFVLNTTRTYLYTHSEEEISESRWHDYQELVTQRTIGHPIAYLTGSKDFWSLTLHVSPDTLIPRPETELLVEQTLCVLKAHHDVRVLDLGTGSGAIALALASEHPQWEVHAYDQSLAALEVAKRNSLQLGLPIHLGRSNWFESIPHLKFNAIVSNPPYIAEADPHLQQGDVRFEPLSALTSGAKGLSDLEKIIAGAPDYLVKGGWLLLEHGYDQQSAVIERLTRYHFTEIQSIKDYQGHVRVTRGRNGYS